MPWYKTGTVSVVLNSNAVTGVGTSFIANCRIGDAFRGPDGRWYEVTNAPSNTSLSIDPPYLGASVSGGSYALAPMQGYVKDSADALRALVNTYGAQLAALGTTGNYDVLPVSKGGTGGTDQATARAGLGLGTTGNYDVLPLIKGGTGATTQAGAQLALGLAVQSSASDVTAGRLMAVGAFGLGGTGIPITEANLNSTRQTQLNIVSAGSLGVLPANINSYVFHWNNPSNGYAYQTCRAVTGGPEYTRYQVAGTWSAWDFRAKGGANTDITELNALTKPLTPAQGGVSDGYIDGLIPTYNSGSSITISAGAAFIPISGKVVRLAAPITLTGISGLTPDVFYYVYLYENAGVATVELSPAAPSAPYFGTARIKNGDASRRFVCALRSGAGGVLYGFQVASSGVILYATNTGAAPFRRLAGGTATTYTVVALSPVVPPTTQSVVVRCTAVGVLANLSVPIAGSTAMVSVDIGSRYQFDFVTDASQNVTYANSGSGGTFFIDVCGYGMER